MEWKKDKRLNRLRSDLKREGWMSGKITLLTKDYKKKIQCMIWTGGVI